MAQLVVRYIRIVEARGSTPLCSTTFKALKSLDFKAFFVSETVALGMNISFVMFNLVYILYQ